MIGSHPSEILSLPLTPYAHKRLPASCSFASIRSPSRRVVQYHKTLGPFPFLPKGFRCGTVPISHSHPRKAHKRCTKRLSALKDGPKRVVFYQHDQSLRPIPFQLARGSPKQPLSCFPRKGGLPCLLSLSTFLGLFPFLLQILTARSVVFWNLVRHPRKGGPAPKRWLCLWTISLPLFSEPQRHLAPHAHKIKAESSATYCVLSSSL